jgi:hypothetical protein
MQESHREEAAHHTDPESCASRRKVTDEALTGAHAWQGLTSVLRGDPRAVKRFRNLCQRVRGY